MTNGAAFLKGRAREMPTNLPYNESDGLRGLGAISLYSGYGKNIIPKLVAEYDFPAEEFFGAWESSKVLIDRWRMKRIAAKMCQDFSDA